MNQLGIDRVARRLVRRTGGLRSERGAFLIETLVGAVLVAVIAVAMLSAVDGANQVSGRTKMRAISASLAQTDQERLRSMPVSMLSNLRQTSAKTVDGVKYNVSSRADWIADNTSTTDCSSNGAAADYMKITSTVSSPAQSALRPVVVQSIVTPAPGTLGTNQGSLAVTVVDRNGAGVANLTVSISGPVDASDVTDSNGCAFFGYEPVGDYTVSAARAGWVDTQGNATASKGASIASQQVSTVSLQYDLAGGADITFDTVATDPGPGGTTAPGTTVTRSPAPVAKAPYVRVAHGQLLPPGYRRFGNGTDQTTISATSLFPFTTAYGAYGGDCDNNDPSKYSVTTPSVLVNPGAGPGLTVRLPALNVFVRRPGAVAVPIANADVKITAVSPCTGTWPYKTNASGTLDTPGLPYGTYDVCVDDNQATPRKIQINGIANTAPGGTAIQVFQVPTSGASGSCP